MSGQDGIGFKGRGRHGAGHGRGGGIMRGQGQGRSRGRGRGRGRGRTPDQKRQRHEPVQQTLSTKRKRKVLLVLHGNRQTGQSLLGRMERLQKQLWKEFEIVMIAPDAPFVYDHDDCNKTSGTTDDSNTLLSWWKRDGDNHIGFEKTLETLLQLLDNNGDSDNEVVGILGFSQGARLAHLVTMLHQHDSDVYFPDMKFVILVAGYDAPIPPQLHSYFPLETFNEAGTVSPDEVVIDSVESLHIWGENDTLVVASESEAVTERYESGRVHTYVHPGNHFVPMKGSDMHIYVDFISQALQQQLQQQAEEESAYETNDANASKSSVELESKQQQQQQQQQPDEESAALQREEIMALEAIFPDSLLIRSSIQREGAKGDEDGPELCDDDVLKFPIVYDMKLSPTEDDGKDDCAATVAKNWPARPLTLRVQYPHNYPLETIPQFSLIHENNIWEFPSARVNRLMTILNQTATDELGMSSVLSCLYAARDYLDSEADPNEQTASTIPINSSAAVVTAKDDDDTDQSTVDTFSSSLITKSSNDEIAAAVKEGLDIAESFLNLSMASVNSENIHRRTVTPSSMGRSLGGGSFGTYTMGLVGKPSAGKSTFFNVATAFSRQRGQRQRSDGDNTFNKNGSKFEGVSEESEWGGASMAAHPFTTIDPNIGYCLVPAPQGSCPEDYFIDKDPSAVHKFGSTHGRDPNGRRFLPVLLKDVAGLVPGAYQGRGRGNQFLNDLTDATVLIHVVDASGTSDAGGNKTVVTGQDGDEYSDPMNDLAWIRNELVEWVFSNLLAKWEVVSRKGKTKLAGMFSGYGQKEVVIDQLLVSLETFMEERYGLDRIYDKMTSWSEADVHRLVSLFLGVRFPMALCLNKIDLPSAKAFVEDIQSSLPIHGAYVGTPLAAKKEMLFVRNHLRPSNVKDKDSSAPSSPPTGVWECLSSALMLQEPVLVFPVSDLSTLAPLPGLSKVAVEDPSLPSKGMIRCIKSAGGIVPTCWNVHDQSYNMPSHSNSKDRDTSQSLNGQKDGQQLRDVLLMRPGSTVEDVFFALKRLGGLGGEFVRAEAFSGRPGGSKPKPIPKHELITAETCVIKIMSNKKSSWQ